MNEVRKDRIAANVVTYNRKQLLGKCLDALLNQTHPLYAIYIIDNASTDGTPEFLMEKGFIDKPVQADREPIEAIKVISVPPFLNKTIEIHYVRIPENTGSAGGQYEGIKRGYEAGFDWLWLMDDDGLPLSNALEKLVKASILKGDAKVLNSLVVDSDDLNKIPFGYHMGFNIAEKKKWTTFFDVKEIERQNGHILDGLAQFFNSTFIHRDVIEKVGFPFKELFIRGDEEEYVFRIQRAGFRTYTVLDSRICHPSPKIKEFAVLGLKLRSEEMNDIKKYYSIRNKTWLGMRYSRIQHRNLITLIIKDILTSLFVEEKKVGKVINSAKLVIKAYNDAKKLKLIQEVKR